MTILERDCSQNEPLTLTALWQDAADIQENLTQLLSVLLTDPGSDGAEALIAYYLGRIQGSSIQALSRVGVISEENSESN